MFHFPPAVRTAANSKLSNVSPLRNKTNILTALMLMSSFNAAMASSDVTHNRPAGQIAYARELCNEVMGFHPDEEHFNGCVSSLVDSLQSASREHAIVEARGQCFAQGQKAGSTGLDLCLLQAAHANPVAGAWTPPDDLNAVDNKDDRAMSAHDFTPSLGTIFDREQRACARLGFDPAFGDFVGCVSDLQNVLQNIDMPGS